MKVDLTKLNNTLILVFLIFCIQATELKIFGAIKLSEIVLLLILPFILFKKVEKHLLYLLVFFVVEMFISLIVTATHHVDYMPDTLLKKPYIITIARSLELFACMCLAFITYRYFKNNPLESRDFIAKLVYYNFFITAIFLFIFILTLIHVIPVQKSVIAYDMFNNYRMRGLYAEGGPYGLMLSFIYILTFFTPKNKKRLFIQLFLIFVIVVPAQSKAGTMCIIMFTFIRLFLYLYKHFRYLLYPAIGLAAIVFVFALTSIGEIYVKEFARIKKSVHERPQDINLVMGRISGTYIVPEMVADRPVFGIGIGNYPIIRNNKEYRGFFPVAPLNDRFIDAHGYGGIVDLLVNYGLIGISAFGLIMYSIYLQVKNIRNATLLLLSFMMLFLFGVQIYFLYPWVLLAILLAYKNNYVHEPGS